MEDGKMMSELFCVLVGEKVVKMISKKKLNKSSENEFFENCQKWLIK